MVLGLILAGVVALFGGAWLLLRPRYRLPTPADETHFAPTGDGWELALYRYRPARPAPGREPVLLCHGMLSNRFNVDLDEEVSLARHLREQGFDAWVMELRGHGNSRRAGIPMRRFDWSLDDYIQRDLPAALRHVARCTGSAQVHWFGHSMGGMILYGACEAPGDPIVAMVRSAVLTDAPASFAPLRRRIRGARLYARLFPAVPPALVLPFLAPLVWLHPAMMEPRYGIGERRRMMSLLANAITAWGSSRVMLQMCDMLNEGRFRSEDRTVDYEQGAGRIRFPLLVLSSARKLMKEEAIEAGHARAPVADKKYLRLTRAAGYLADYTHSNILLSATSRQEVFPIIAAWFRDHSSA